MRCGDMEKIKVFKKEELWSLPNQLSYVRLLLIPVFVWLYQGLDNHVAALVVIVFSGLTDVLDGYIARRYHMVTDLGKILDPAADKLTQAALLVCLSLRYPLLWAVAALLVVKEISMAALGWVVVQRTGKVHSARWYGKVCTAVLYGVMCLLILLSSPSMELVNGLIALCAGVLLMAFVLYIRYDLRLLKEAQAREK